MDTKKLLLLPASLLFLCALVSAATLAETLPSVGTYEVIGKHQDLEIAVLVQGPSANTTPLQIICLFDEDENDIYASPPALPKELNGLVHVDEALKGLISELRKSKNFSGRELETLLINSSLLASKNLLLIGLGKKDDFNAEKMKWIGLIGMREALRLKVESYSHASDLKDAGFDSPTSEIASNVLLGALKAFNTQKKLNEQSASDPITVKKITFLSGPSYFEDTKMGLKQNLND